MAGDTLAERCEKTIAGLVKITKAWYHVEVQRECEFDKDILAANPELEVHPIVLHEPLNTRDALYGGRTEAKRLHYKAAEVETNQYVDVMSLYPYICKYFKFPICHPVIQAGDDCADTDAMLQKDGLIKSTILPPKHLFHPVLLFLFNNQLLFCLCNSYAMQQNLTVYCKHETVAERALTGTWVLDEIRLAVQHGYEVVEVHEVYEYQVTRCDPHTGDKGLFAQYINTFMKLKAESSEYPNWVQCPTDEGRYISEFQASEGILLDRQNIGPNPAKRGLANLCLNSMWGKLTERNNRTRTKKISDPQELYRFLVTPVIEVAA
jgi:hypothetical protein